jgi:hypothetical protein
MPLVLPDLDTRRFAELVVEGRSLIPLHAPTWTDHNVSDPGITLVELIAAEIERDVYRANRVPDRNRRKLLALVGEAVSGPRAGRAVVAAVPLLGAPGLLPAGVELTLTHGDTELAATTLAALPLVPGAITAVQVLVGSAATDVTARLATTGAVPALGDDPVAGAALALGLDAALPAAATLALHLDLDGSLSGAEGEHHGARVVWEVLAGGAWVPATGVADPTRALTQPGVVTLTLPAAVALAPLGTVATPRAWVRARLAEGRHDRAPLLRGASANAVEVALARPACSSLVIAPGADVPPAGTVVAGTPAALAFALDAATGAITRLVVADDGAAPAVAVLDYAAPTATGAGRLVLEAAPVGTGDGTPEQVFTLADGGPVLGDARVWTLETDGAHAVELREDLDAAGRRDRDAVLDAARGTLRFGDGHAGRVPAAGDALLSAWRATSAGAGAGLRPPATGRLRAGARNELLLGGDPGAIDTTLTLSLVTPVRDAADAEDVAAVAARAERRIWAHERLVSALQAAGATSLDELEPEAVAALAVPERAVTLADHERIALATPGTRIARARAFVDLHPDVAPGLRAAGCVTVVVVPCLPAGRPAPTDGLLDAVAGTLAPRRLVGARIFVTGPAYVVVDVSARVAVVANADPRDAVRAVLQLFLHPLTGGPAGRGWPFGRDVYRSEVLQTIDEVEGVDHVEDLTLAQDGGPPSCGNLCVPPTALVVAGSLTVEVAS